ncbi:MAG: chemotaxis protein CheD [Paracoccaceae bacterium]
MSESTQKITTIMQGDFAVSADANEAFSTILGSCIAVCLHDAGRKIGGMNHFLLPTAGSSSDTAQLKYGTNAMELLINNILREGGSRSRLTAKLFGGATLNAKLGDIGRSNITFARAFLAREAIPCVSESLGGDRARRIRFCPTTGHAKQILIPSSACNDLDLVDPVRRPVTQPEITLF